VATSIVVELQAILDLNLILVGQFQAIILTADDIQDCAPTFVLIVNLLTEIFVLISSGCTRGKQTPNPNLLSPFR
jgi:hypothetical protein